ncbi:MAG: hypothetical protein IAG10_12840 [Planctomycetaceae bacterium]|nr:hypothetical protein [Planctomycetaceae bacterium]
MSLLHRVSNAIGDAIIGPWGSVTIALVISASVLAVVIVGLFRLVGRPQGIRRARNRLLARTLELLLFGHDGRSLLTATGRILAANAVYLWQFALPLLVSTIPITLLLIQGASWFAHRPYRVDEPIVVEAILEKGQSVLDTPVSMNTSGNLRITAGPVRIPAQGELCYRLIATSPGDGWADVMIGDRSFRKQIRVGDRLERLATERRLSSKWMSWLHPAEELLPEDSPFERISTHYPQRTWNWGLSEYDACLVGVLLTLVLSLIFARVFRVSLV